MRFYKVHRTHEGGTSAGFEYFTSKREAQRAVVAWHDERCEQFATVEVVDVETTRQGILRALNLYAKHPDTG